MRTATLRTLGRVLVLALLLFTVACGDDPLTPIERIAGEYEATTLLVTEDGETLDALERGVRIEITLTEDGLTFGRFFVPGGEDDGRDFDADLTGVWELSDGGRIVALNQAADTFLRDIELRVEDGRLVSDAGGIRLVLTRQ